MLQDGRRGCRARSTDHAASAALPILLIALLGTRCTGGGAGPCGADLSPCAGGVCLAGRCEPGTGDADADGLSNADEVVASTDPRNWDTDGDGVADGEEVGPDTAHPRDTDGDGVPDALESARQDSDRDCVPDQADERDDDPHPPADLVTKVNCSRKGVCGAAFALVSSRCDGGAASCDYSLVPGYQGVEDRCDWEDNDCDGQTDEGFALEGIPVGMACPGRGECGPGVVECMEDGTGTRCSTLPGGSLDASVPETCNGRDDDCDGMTDDGMALDGGVLGGPCRAAGTCGAGTVECAPDGGVTCSSGPGGSEDRSAPEVCNGQDDDCDGQTDDDVPVEGNPLDHCKPVGVCATHADKVRLACRDGRPACDFSGVPGYSGKAEALCDGKDDDCDGLQDEDFTWVDGLGGTGAVGQPCGVGACVGGTVACAADGLSAVCSTSGLAKPEECNEADDDCDGFADDGWPKVFALPPILLDPGVPPPRARAALAGCPGGDSLYLYGGVGRIGASGEATDVLGDFWRYDLKAHRFVPIPGPTPGGRSGATLVCDAEGARLFLVAGLPEGSGAAGLWSFSLDFLDWAPIEASVPARGSVGAVFDPDGRTLLVVRADAPEAVVVTVDAPSATPVPVDLPFRRDPAFAGAAGSLFLSGGRDEGGEVRGDLFRVGADGAVSLVGSGLPARARHALAALSDGSLLLVGGEGPDGTPAQEAFLIRPDTGVAQPVGVPLQLPPLLDPALVTTGNGAFLHSGLTPEGRGFRKVLRFDEASGQWTTDLLDATPGPRAGGTLAVLRSRATAFLLGGFAVDVAASFAVNEVWSLGLLDGQFRRLQTEGATPTLIRGAAAADEASGTVFVFGGLDRPPGPDARATATFWRLDPAALVVESLPTAGGPSSRSGHTMVAAGSSGPLIVYGGSEGDTTLGDVWAWTPAASWFPLDAIPHPRSGHAAFWDTALRRMVVVAGDPGGDVAAFDPISRTWTPLVQHPLLLDAGGAAFFDPDSRLLLYLPSSGNEVLQVVLPLDAVPTWSVSKLSVVSFETLSAYDPLGRRALFYGGTEPGGRTLSAAWSLTQTCPGRSK